MKWFIYLLIFFSFINNLYGFGLTKDNFSINFNIETNFTNLFDSNSPFSISFSQIDLNKINFFLLGNGELKFKFKDWEITGFYQGDIWAKTIEPTREFIQKLKNRESLIIGKNYDIFLEIEGFSVVGGKVSKILNFKDITFIISSKFLYGFDIQMGKLFGNFMRLDEESYKFNLFLEYLYNENYLYKRRDLKRGYGLGFSFDLDLSFNLFKDFFITLSLLDFYGKIYWKKVPYTIADATTEREYYDEYGNIVYRPLIRGYEGYKDYNQNIPLKTKLLLKYNIHPITLSLDLNYIKDCYFYHVKISYLWTFLKNFNVINSSYYKYYMEIPSEIGFVFSGDNMGIYCVFFYFFQVL
ncbi:MAG: hypothetical protein ABDH25_00925 [Dictyoglomaceae bacterium]